MGAILYTKTTFLFNHLTRINFFITLICAIFILILKNFSTQVYYFSLIALPLCYLFIVIYLINKKDNMNDPPSVFSLLGKYTYAMYFYHPILIIFVKIAFDCLALNYKNNWTLNVVMAIISLMLTIGVSILSYRYFEKPILELKRKFSVVTTRI